MKYLRYYSDFRDINGTAWRVELYQENENPFIPESADLSADGPLTIDWKEIAKEDPVASSSATVKFISDRDRRFLDLYHVDTDHIRLDIYRNGKIYWSGMMDPELYEEPFSYKQDYDVELTFSDFAVLERKNWTAAGFKTLRECLTICLAGAGMVYDGVIEFISTSRNGIMPDELLDKDSVLCDNFYDEKGEAQTLREVLENILLPYDLHIKQKNGKIYLWDWNALCEMEPQTVQWDAGDAVLSVDKVYNNLKLTFSPYEIKKLMDGQIKENSVKKDASGTELRIYCDMEQNSGKWVSPEGFDLLLSDTGKGLEKNPLAKFYKIKSIYSGQDSEGIAWCVETIGTSGYTQYVQEPVPVNNELLFRVPDRPYIGNNGVNRQVRLNLELLCDVRYNPFEQAALNNEEGNWDKFKNWCNFAYIPIILNLCDSKGVPRYHYDNSWIKNSYGCTGRKTWVIGAGTWGNAFLAYYDKDDRKSSCGLGGWQGNKQCIGYYRKNLPASFKKMKDGEYIPLPPGTGYLELKIGTGIQFWDYNKDPVDGTGNKKRNIYPRIRWLMYKDPKITVCDQFGNEIETDDIEYSAWINPAAKESLSIDTILGTLDESSPVARGQIYDSVFHRIVNTYNRGGRTDRLEKLLMGTLYSQYGTRHNQLKGTVGMLDGFGIYTDKNEPGKYAVMGETQNIRECTSDIQMTAVTPDEYDALEFIEEE